MIECVDCKFYISGNCHFNPPTAKVVNLTSGDTITVWPRVNSDDSCEFGKLIGSNSMDMLAGPYEVEVTTESKSLEELGITLHNNLEYLTLIPAGVGIFWADGEATTGINPFPSSGAEIKIVKEAASTREFVTTSGTIKMQVIQEGGGVA